MRLGRDFTRYDLIEVWYWYCALYHNGQGSKLYERLCKSKFRPGPMAREPTPDDSVVYDLLREIVTKRESL